MSDFFDKARVGIAGQADRIVDWVDRTADSSMGAIDSIELLWLRLGRALKSRPDLGNAVSTQLGTLKGRFDASSLQTVASGAWERVASRFEQIKSIPENINIFSKLSYKR